MTTRSSEPMAPDLTMLPDWVGTAIVVLAAVLLGLVVVLLLVG